MYVATPSKLHNHNLYQVPTSACIVNSFLSSLTDQITHRQNPSNAMPHIYSTSVKPHMRNYKRQHKIINYSVSSCFVTLVDTGPDCLGNVLKSIYLCCCSLQYCMFNQLGGVSWRRTRASIWEVYQQSLTICQAGHRLDF